MEYFNCLNGDQMPDALTEPGVFVVTDTRGRNWLCWPGTEADMMAGPGVRMEQQQKAYLLGLTTEGTSWSTHLTTRDQLPSRLGK